MAEQPAHIPVLLDRVLELLAPALESSEAPVIIDATLGLGGHTEAVLERFNQVHVIGVDRDPHALAHSAHRLQDKSDRVSMIQAVYDQLGEVMSGLGKSHVNAVLFDLGVSSMQLDMRERGFAYAHDSPLDMRMNPADGLSAAEVLNTYSAKDLARVLREYGEEKFARRIADAVIAARVEVPFSTSNQLVEIVRTSIPAPARRTGGNPAKRTFQALRIEVNDELRVYQRALPQALDIVGVGGRVVVLSYHSLEDRITKREFASVTENRAPRGLPVVPEEFEARFKLCTRGAEKATESEIAQNARARSARLRAVERVAA